MSTTTKPVIIDSNSKHDDLLAILWALSSGRLDVRAVTCVAGTQPVDQAVAYALQTLTWAGATPIPVARGAASPLLHPHFEAGTDAAEALGLEGIDLPAPACEPSDLSAAELMAQVLEQSEEKVTICSTGPLTNIALLFATRPDLIARIERLSIVGGGAGRGNITPVAEFNMFADPEAASLIFRSGVPITLSVLEATHQAYFTEEDRKAIRDHGTEHTRLVAELLDRLALHTGEDDPDCASIAHGTCAIAAVLNPDLFTSIQTHVDVEVAGDLTRGMTIINQVAFLNYPVNAEVLLGVDRERFVDCLMQSLDHS